MYSQWFAVPYQLIVDANRHISSERLKAGEVVNIPGWQAVQVSGIFENIARSLSIPFEAVKRLNPQLTDDITVSQPLRIPKRIKTRLVNGKRNYDFAAMDKELKELCEYYPFIKKRTIGKSVLGLPLLELKIGRGSKQVHINGSFHANEWITSAVIMTFVNDYLLALTNSQLLNGCDILSFYEQITLSIVPMVNPDGVNLVLNGPPEKEPYRSEAVRMNNGSLDFSDWKANIRGVDLNNQFPAKWEVEKERKLPKAPAPRDFPGFAPLTEPETIAMAKLTEENNFSKILAFHTQGKEIYWGYEGLEPAEAEQTVNEFSKVSGYKAVRYIDSHAGYRDWFIYTWKRQGYTIELGEGVNPLPIEQFDEIYNDSLGIFLAALYMD
jgi:g-D-glutamyl-meso-diaminopimelate peptidase